MFQPEKQSKEKDVVDRMLDQNGMVKDKMLSGDGLWKTLKSLGYKMNEISCNI